jgi:PTS system glucitol/sorbitol-specific IIC component
MQALIEKIGRSVGGVVGTLFQAGRDAVDLCLKTIIPFMAFVTFVIGLILETGVGDAIANGIKGFASSLGGLMIVCIICAIPVLSPLLGPGAVIAQIVGVLIGTEIGRGNIDVSMALPALFAINPQVGCDFVPVGLALGEAEPVTVGVPAVLTSRMITGPISVVVGYLFALGL